MRALLGLTFFACTGGSGSVGRLTAALDATPNGIWERRDRGAMSVEDHVRLVHDAGRQQVLLVSARPPQE